MDVVKRLRRLAFISCAYSSFSAFGILQTFARIASPNEESLCHSYDRSRCDEYNECNETVITCGSTPTGISNYCFAAWENSTGVPTVMLKGCWNNEHQCSSRSECIANEEERHHQVFFCCCDEDYCNADFKFVPEPPSVDYDNESCADASCGDPSNDLPVWLIPVATLPVLILLMIVFYIVFTYRQKRKRRADQAESDATSPLTDPLNIPADSTVSQAPIHLLEQKSIGRFPVWKAEQGNNFVAVKLFSAQDESTWFHEQEVYRLPHISHPSILKFIHADRCGALDAPFRLVLEFHPHGSLYDFLKANVLSPAAICRLGESMARGLGHLHEEIPGRNYKPAVVHRDFKSKNVLVKADGTACIADFGLALVFWPRKTGEDHGQVGTVRYMSPEVLEGAINFDRDAFLRIDMYACGLVLWELLSRCSTFPESGAPYRMPFEVEVGHNPTLEAMQDAVVIRRCRPHMPDHWRENPTMSRLCHTIDECWDADAEARISAQCVAERISAVQKRPSSIVDGRVGGRQSGEFTNGHIPMSVRPTGNGIRHVSNSTATEEIGMLSGSTTSRYGDEPL